MSLPPAPKPYSLQLAERIHHTTGKDNLPRICVGGFLMESFWHSIIERRVLKTPPPAIKKAMLRAVVTWPLLYIVTGTAVSWAAWRVDQAERARAESSQRHS